MKNQHNIKAIKATALVVAVLILLVIYRALQPIEVNTISGTQYPSISIITPSSGPAGTIITISGNSFVEGGTWIAVSDSAKKVWDPVSVTSTQVVFKIPDGIKLGTHSISVYTGMKNLIPSNSHDFVVTEGQAGKLPYKEDGYKAPIASKKFLGSPQFKTYTDLTYGFAINYPSNLVDEGDSAFHDYLYSPSSKFLVLKRISIPLNNKNSDTSPQHSNL